MLRIFFNTYSAFRSNDIINGYWGDNLVDESQKEKINDLSEEEIGLLNISVNQFKTGITREKHADAIRYCDWLSEKLDINCTAKE